ncbi:UDP-N-acetylglucosamine 1-carboxyvinyltransferase [Patescibacteria group bacterium]|nr:UDP-N-acetylglucosamine 1-carboxyvinyltransferase [Patescibacteria group bacterium]MCL5091768.1 UDP-N-acetylglucosamine 1-carboxyvinyltransferase [Patescibacteria group bacterium]
MVEDAYIIQGGKILRGEVQLSGAKNIALKTMIAALLFDGPVTLHNVPRIRDVDELINLIRHIGGEADFVAKNTLVVNGKNIGENRLDFLYAAKVRVSFMFFAPLLYKFHQAFIPNPGGCRLGARSINRVIAGMEALGIRVTYDSTTGYYRAQMNEKPKGRFRFEKPSHTGTEMMIILSVLSDNQIVIENAALEPEVDDLINFLNRSGAAIKREGTTIKIRGVGSLKQSDPYVIACDRNEAATFICLALASRGEVVVSDIPKNYIGALVEALERAGAQVKQIKANHWYFAYSRPLRAVNIETTPYPGFMTDWQPLWAVLMTQAHGVSQIHERLFENRFSYVDELKKLGANIEFINLPVVHPEQYYFFNYSEKSSYSQAIKVTGPQQLHNGVLTVGDLRAGATLAIAALIAQGESVVSGVSILERGYEDFVAKVRALGGTIKKV